MRTVCVRALSQQIHAFLLNPAPFGVNSFRATKKKVQVENQSTISNIQSEMKPFHTNRPGFSKCFAKNGSLCEIRAFAHIFINEKWVKFGHSTTCSDIWPHFVHIVIMKHQFGLLKANHMLKMPERKRNKSAGQKTAPKKMGGKKLFHHMKKSGERETRNAKTVSQSGIWNRETTKLIRMSYWTTNAKSLVRISHMHVNKYATFVLEALSLCTAFSHSEVSVAKTSKEEEKKTRCRQSSRVSKLDALALKLDEVKRVPK